MQTEVLKVKNLDKYFSNGQEKVQVLNKVSFSIKEGEYVAISGPSGCGKSTLLNILGLLDTPDSGEYYIDGLLVSDMNANQRAALRSRRVGFVFQAFNLIDEITVLENVALPLKYRGESLKTRTAKAIQCLEKMGLEDKMMIYPNQLSGGQQQRVSIARALAIDSGIILVDEPTGNLDSKNGDAVMAILDSLHQQGTTICLVTHEEKYAQMATRTISMFDGQVILNNKDTQEAEIHTSEVA